MLVVNGRAYSRSIGTRSTTLVPVLQKNDMIQNSLLHKDLQILIAPFCYKIFNQNKRKTKKCKSAELFT